jgi:hypothetical protein
VVGGDNPAGSGGSALIAGGDANHTLVLGYSKTNNYGWIQAENAGVGGTNLLLNTIGGNVGVGTISPNALLHVKSGSNADSTGQPSGTWASIVYNAINSSGANGLLVKTNWAAITPGATAFEVGLDNVSGAYASLFKVTSTGIVGVGTSSPSCALDVNGVIRAMGGNFPTTGAGMELLYSGVASQIQSYDRNASAWKPLYLGGADLYLNWAGQGIVAIGTTTTGATCHIHAGGSDNQLMLSGASATKAVGFTVNNGVGDPTQGGLAIQKRTASTGAFEANWIGLNLANGFVGLGTLFPAHQLELSTNDAGKPTSSSWTITSDGRTKRKITPMTDDAVSILNKLRWIRYEYNGLAGTPDGDRGMGLVAQEMRAHLPEAVRTVKAKLEDTDEQPTDLYGLDFHAISVMTALAIQQLDARLKKAGI